MRKIFSVLLALSIALAMFSVALADKPIAFDGAGNEMGWAKTGCTTIQSGSITDAVGNPISVGFDQFGYNYQAHEFNGTYDSSDRVLDGMYWGQTGDFVDDKLEMKWSDDWLANVDCNNDGKLDRGLVNGSSDGISKGWLTNHVNGDYFDANGVAQHYTDFVKIGYVGSGGHLWGAYEILQEVYNDPAAGFHGSVIYFDPGLGRWVTR